MIIFPSKKTISIEGIIKIAFGVLGVLFFFGPFTSIKITTDIISLPFFQITKYLSGYAIMFNITSKSILIFLYILCTWILLLCYFVSLIIGAFEVAEIDLEVLKYKNKIINLAFWIGYGCVVYSILINVLSSDLTIGLFTILIFLKHNVLLGYTIYNKRFKKK